MIKAVLSLIALTLLISLSCGKRKPPLPPRERVVQRAELSGFQRGGQIRLEWTLPKANAAASSAGNISRVDIYRLSEEASSPIFLKEEEFSDRSSVIASEPTNDADFARQKMTYIDSPRMAQNLRLRYAVRYVNASGQRAAFSNFLVIETSPTSGPPASLSAETTQDAIELKWTAPQTDASGTAPPAVLGYNIYRSPSENDTGKLLNKAPVKELSYNDGSFEFGKTYYYFVRAVSAAKDGSPLESLETNIVRVQPVDTFAPAPPSSITLASTPDRISIFFPSNTENDIAGYRIYRSNDPAFPKAEWTLLTPDPITTNTFQDKNVEQGKTYFYYLTAVDKAGNVSAASAVVSETIQ